MDDYPYKDFSGYPQAHNRLYRAVQARAALRVGGAILWFIGWTLSCAVWGLSHNEYLSPAAWTVLGLLIGCCAWPIFRLKKHFRDRDFEGTITSMKRAYIYYDSTPWLRNAPRKVPQIIATVQPDEGEAFKYRFPPEDEDVANYYRVGDRVRHYRGLRYLEKQDKPEDIIICVECGKYSYITEDVCEFCKKPLLK